MVRPHVGVFAFKVPVTLRRGRRGYRRLCTPLAAMVAGALREKPWLHAATHSIPDPQCRRVLRVDDRPAANGCTIYPGL